MARKLLADPELPRKLAEGRPEEIRPCIYCYTCVGNIFLNESTACAVNPATGREREFAIEPAATPKRVLVIGGGPAGMETARVAALRGHRVTLCERRARLGGTLGFSSLVYPENGRLARWLETQIRKLPIELRLGTAVDADFARRFAPDAVVVAVGAARTPSAIPGADRPNVFDGDDLRALLAGESGAASAHELAWPQRVLLGAGRALGLSQHFGLARSLSRVWMPLGRRVAIVGGGLVGIELAEFLLERGREVSVLEASGNLAVHLRVARRRKPEHPRGRLGDPRRGHRAESRAVECGRSGRPGGVRDRGLRRGRLHRRRDPRCGATREAALIGAATAAGAGCEADTQPGRDEAFDGFRSGLRGALCRMGRFRFRFGSSAMGWDRELRSPAVSR